LAIITSLIYSTTYRQQTIETDSFYLASNTKFAQTIEIMHEFLHPAFLRIVIGSALLAVGFMDFRNAANPNEARDFIGRLEDTFFSHWSEDSATSIRKAMAALFMLMGLAICAGSWFVG